MKIAVYTSIIPANYTTLRPPCFVNPEIDYILFSDEVTEVPPWQTHLVRERESVTARRESARYKMFSHKYLDYDWVIWLDGCARLRKDPVELVEMVRKAGYTLSFGRHPWWNCLYEEAKFCSRYHYDSAEIIEAQMARYRAEGYPEQNGLVASTFFIRDNRDPKTCEFFDLWHEEYIKGSKRSQLSANYALWKVGLEYLELKIPWGSNEIWTTHGDL